MLRKQRTISNRRSRHLRLRKKVRGTSERPRLSVYPSGLHMEAQIINDLESKTLVGLTTKAGAFKKTSGLKSFGNVKAAESFGKFVAEKAREKGIEKVVFDRGGFQYHGRIRAFAEAARGGGLQF
jgi:large subunit ribosomal protein L18